MTTWQKIALSTHKRKNRAKVSGFQRKLQNKFWCRRQQVLYRTVLGLTHLFSRRTEASYIRRAKNELFDALSPTLSAAGAGQTHAETANALGMTESAVKVAVHRLRKEYRRQLREAVASTVELAGDVQDELETLLAALRPSQQR